MDQENRPQSGKQDSTSQRTTHEEVKNPFENHQPVEKDIAQAKEDLEKEQQFKEAQTERD